MTNAIIEFRVYDNTPLFQRVKLLIDRQENGEQVLGTFNIRHDCWSEFLYMLANGKIKVSVPYITNDTDYKERISNPE